MHFLAVFIGGGIGSLLRYTLTLFTSTYFGSKGAIIGTLLSNIFACLLLGLVIYVFKDKLNTSSFFYPFLTVGVCGGFSTFSTFSNQTVELINQKMYGLVSLNILFSFLICLGLLYFLSKQQG
ncbi:MAG: fluoride efflux transporter FluC [Lishizhenia sp.]